MSSSNRESYIPYLPGTTLAQIRENSFKVFMGPEFSSDPKSSTSEAIISSSPETTSISTSPEEFLAPHVATEISEQVSTALAELPEEDATTVLDAVTNDKPDLLRNLAQRPELRRVIMLLQVLLVAAGLYGPLRPTETASAQTPTATEQQTPTQEQTINVGDTITLVFGKLGTIRKAPTDNSVLIEVAPFGTEYKVLAVQDEWVQIETEKGNNWVKITDATGQPNFLTVELGGGEETPAIPETITIEQRTTTTTVNVRKGPTTEADKWGALEPNTVVTVLGIEDTTNDGVPDWYQVSYIENGKEVGVGEDKRFVSADFLSTPTYKEVPNPDFEAQSTEEGAGGPVGNQEIIDAAEVLNLQDFSVLSLLYTQPLAVNSASQVVGIQYDGRWISSSEFFDAAYSADLTTDAKLQIIFQDGKLVTNNGGKSYSIQNSKGESIGLFANDILTLRLEQQLQGYLKSSGIIPPADITLPLQIEMVNEVPTAVINDITFLYKDGRWIFLQPAGEAPLEPVTTSIESNLPQVDIKVTINPEYDFSDRVKLSENAEEILIQQMADAFSKSDVLAPIMGDTPEEVIAYLKEHDYVLPPQFRVPYQLPPVFEGQKLHDRIKFEPTEQPVSLKDIELQFVINNESEKYQHITDRLLWTGNSPGGDGTALWINDEGKLVLTAVVKDRDMYEDTDKLMTTAVRRLLMIVKAYDWFNGNELAQGDEMGYVNAFSFMNSVNERFFLQDTKLGILISAAE